MINQNWVFGNNAGLDFTLANAMTPPTSTSGFAINTLEGCASISSGSGNLLFYTDGVTVWDSNHVQRYTGLLGDPSSTQSAIIVPDPNPSHPDQYYIFTTDGSSSGSGPYNHFDGILLNTTSWVATPLSSLMAMPSTAGLSPVEKLTAIQHKNCKDFWIITIVQDASLDAMNGLGIFRVFSVTASGVSHSFDIGMNVQVNDLGYLKASPDGASLAIANGQELNVLIYPFDNSTGTISVSGSTIIPTPPGSIGFVYGIEFSPNSKIAYYGVMAFGAPAGSLYQVDLSALPSIPSSVQVGTIPALGGSNYTIGALQLGVDNRIYFARDLGNVLGAILTPDVLGVGCNVNDSYVSLASGSQCQLGLPNLLPNPCQKNGNCNCGCNGCNEDAAAQNAELIDRAKAKFFTIPSINNSNCVQPFSEHCDNNAIISHQNLEPCFYFQWGDGHNDQIEEHDTEVFYITVCNRFNDIQYNGLRITKITLNPNTHPIEKIQIVPDRFICLDCLEPCSCQTREFALITRANNTADHYTMEVEYCYESITFASGGNSGKATFDLEITED